MIDTEILQDYTSEAQELLDEMDNSLMRLEKEGPVPELLNNIFRAVHCIKGSAQYIGLESSSTLTHGVENLLDRLREGAMPLEPPIIDFLFRAKDLIAQLINEVGRYRQEKTDISGIMRQLNAILSGSPLPAKPSEEPSKVTPPVHSEEEEAGEALQEPVSPAVIPDVRLGKKKEEFPVATDLGSEHGQFGEDEPPEDMTHVLTGLDSEGSLDETQPLDDFSVLAMEDTDIPSAILGEISSEQVSHEAEEKQAVSRQEVVEAPSGEPLGPEGWDPTETLEGTVSRLLSISLYLEDLQDGFLKPDEISATFLKELDQIRRSMVVLGLPEAVEVLDALEQRFKAIEPAQEVVPHQDIQAMKELLQDLKPFYPEKMFPLEPHHPTPEQDISPLVSEEAAPASLKPKIEEEKIDQPERLDGESRLVDSSRLSGTLEGQSFESAPAAVPEYQPTIPRKRSMLADVDDELLNEFEGIFSQSHTVSSEASSAPIGPTSDLLEGIDVVGEGTDSEIIEIFLSYGFEIAEKLRPLIESVVRGEADAEVLGSAAELVRTIHGSATYMDYQKVAAFLDEWYERTLGATEQLGILRKDDLMFMEENFKRFQEFLVDLKRMLHADVIPPTVSIVASPQAPQQLAREEAVASGALEDIPSSIVKEKPATQEGVARFETEVAVPAPESVIVPAEKETPLPPSTEESVMSIPLAQTATSMREQPVPLQAGQDSVPPSPPVAEGQIRTQEAGPLRDIQEGAAVKTMRVDAAKVDTLLNQVGELVVNRSYVEQLSLTLKLFQRTLTSSKEIGKREIQTLKDLSLKMTEASVALGRVVTDIQEGVMKLRMLPVGQLFNRMPRLIRDLSRRVGKSVSLEMYGADTEVDKRVIEQIYNPLVHLIRNAVDHGIEDPETRSKLGKPKEGLIVLRAYSQGNQVSIDVEDDGAGIRSEAVLKRAVEHRLIDPQEAANLTPQDVYNFLFLPGFSTSETVTRTSGRGVGMDVVKKDVEKINGHVEIESWEDRGTRVSIKIPLTLAIIQTLLIRSARHVFAIPLTSVREIIQVSRSEIVTIEGFEVIKFREETIPVLRVREIFNLKGPDQGKLPRFLVLANAGLRTVGFLVEELIGEQDVVIKPLAEHIVKSRGLAGSTILGDGTIALVLDVTEIVDDVIAQQRQVAAQGFRSFQQGEARSLAR